MRKQAGATLLEVIIAIVLLLAIATVGWSQAKAIEATHRDSSRKVAINAVQANLEEVIYPKLGGYPRVLRDAQLKAMDTKLLTDPNGQKINEPSSNYRYEAMGCNGTNTCEHYVLRTTLERETDFIKPSLH